MPTDSRKLHRCTVPGCGKAFTRVSHLQRHALNHTEVKWHCHRCDTFFKRIDLLERHKERHSRKDALAGGPGLGTLQARRKIICGADLCNDSLQEEDLEKIRRLQANESKSTQRIPKSDDGEPIDNGTGIDLGANSTHQHETPKEPPPPPAAASAAAAISPTNALDRGDMNYDTSFDSPHFDLMEPSFSPRYTLAEVHWDNMDYLSPNNVAREEVLNLLAEIQSVYENRSLVDEINAALSLVEMQEYLRLFVQKFNLSYPLIHIPTLEVAKTESILLLSMIILGASYKTKDSHRMSVRLYDAIVPYILSGLTSIPVPTLSTLQAFLILESYGMYRAGPYQREMAMLIHTLLFNTIRRISRYHVRGGIMLPKHLKRPINWEEFAYAEQYKRLILFVFMWDTQNVSCYSFMPSMSTHTIQVPHPCTEEAWTAPCPSAWQRIMEAHDEPPDFGDTMKWLVEDNEKLQSIRLDYLRLTLLLHGLMSMCNDMIHFDNRSIYLGDLEEQEVSWRPWRKRMTSALGTWKIKYDALAMATMQTHIVINGDIRQLLGAAGAKAIFGHAVTLDDHQESYRWVKIIGMLTGYSIIPGALSSERSHVGLSTILEVKGDLLLSALMSEDLQCHRKHLRH
ncbi:hypothetical protein UA08_00851 [Talaromyces atroroseus]|uniref:C2H2-type domain-containing protein n=1 Tax=Talaromyces atroroseus TaxID=1441469 RepID=A0A225BEG7_TALAT|nr:hypothetical protein UA08_00851 [Talaromyces atroroseus]OKL64427.1 hypothetical protein UA08_00851 [Talaromyces atroroseus]